MKLLIIGANGQLGWELGKRGSRQGFDTICVDLPEFNLIFPIIFPMLEL